MIFPFLFKSFAVNLIIFPFLTLMFLVMIVDLTVILFDTLNPLYSAVIVYLPGFNDILMDA